MPQDFHGHSLVNIPGAFPVRTLLSVETDWHLPVTTIRSWKFGCSDNWIWFHVRR